MSLVVPSAATVTSPTAAGSSGGGGSGVAGGTILPPTDSSRMKVHNRDLFVELLALEEEDDASKSPRSDKQKRHKALNPMEIRQAKAVELQLQKKAAREAEFQTQLETAKRDAERRQRDRTKLLHEQFESKFAHLVDESTSFVRAVGESVEDHEARLARRKERLYDEWCKHVFDPIQSSIDGLVSSTTATELNAVRRDMFQQYLTEFNKKKCGLFRDIIIEADYNPMNGLQNSTVKYVRPQLRDDPTKNRETREGNKVIVPVQQPQRRGAASSQRVDVLQWGTIEATPHGWHANDPEGGVPKRKDAVKSTLVLDHYNVPKGDQGLELIKKENQVRGKKFPKPVEATNTI